MRAKFRCIEVSVRDLNGVKSFTAKLEPVQSDDDNKELFAYTPSGVLEFASIKNSPFVIDKEYLLELTAVE